MIKYAVYSSDAVASPISESPQDCLNSEDFTRFRQLAKSLGVGETLAFPDGTTYTQREVYVELLRCDPTSAVTYFDLANTMKDTTGSVRLADGRSMNKLKLYALAIHYQPDFAAAYRELAYSFRPMNTEDFKSGSPLWVTLADGQRKTGRELLEQTIRLNPMSAKAHVDLGLALQYEYVSNGLSEPLPVTTDDGRLTKTDLFVRAFQLSSATSTADAIEGLTYLCGFMGYNASVTLGGVPYRKQEICEKCINMTLSVPANDFSLDYSRSFCMDYGNISKVTLLNGMEFTQLSAALHGLREDRNYITFFNAAWGLRSPGLTIDMTGREVELIDGRRMNQRQLYLESIRLNPRFSWTYCWLGATLSSDETVILPDGTVVGRNELRQHTILSRSSLNPCPGSTFVWPERI